MCASRRSGRSSATRSRAARQYALRERAVELGWPAESVAVVDEDIGRSGATSDGRLGFNELVAEVGLGHVGLILALETSRLARSSADWHQLLDLCALTGTLIADADGVYSPNDFNDRLLLGLKGTMSEAELHLIRARLDGGLRNKAARGELRLALPVGLDRDDDGRIVLCPDEQVRHAIERVFALWRRLGSARQVVIELVAEGQQLPRRTVGQRRIRWARASYGAVHDFLTNPAYAGAFVFGRKRREKRLDAQGRVRVRDVEVPLEQWSVCLPEHHPGYVSWPQYLQTRERLRANVRPRGEGGGAAREGAALLQGIAALRALRTADAGRLFRNRRQGPPLCVRARPPAPCAPAGPASRSAAAGSTRRSPPRSWRPSPRPACAATAGAVARAARPTRRAARRPAARASSAPSSRPTARAASSTPASPSTGSSRARSKRALEDALAAVERERGKLAALEQARPAPLTDERARRARAPRARSAAALEGRDDDRS